MRDYYYLQTRNKTAAWQAVEKLKKDFDITNIDELEESIRGVRVTSPGQQQGITKKSKQDKKAVLSAVKGAIAVDFATLDGAPVLYVDTLIDSDLEVRVLKTYGFVPEPASWQREVTRGQMINLLRKMRSLNPKLKIAEWETFKEKAKVSFRGLDLSEFDDMGIV